MMNRAAPEPGGSRRTGRSTIRMAGLLAIQATAWLAGGATATGGHAGVLIWFAAITVCPLMAAIVMRRHEYLAAIFTNCIVISSLAYYNVRWFHVHGVPVLKQLSHAWIGLVLIAHMSLAQAMFVAFVVRAWMRHEKQ